MSAQELADLKAFAPGMTDECLERARYGGIAAISSRYGDECYEMQPSRIWRGLWRADFEGSRFCPEPATQCRYDTPGEEIWLHYSREIRAADAEPGPRDGVLYEIEFLGSRTAVKGYYGHMGLYDHEIVVEKIKSVRLLPDTQISDLE